MINKINAFSLLVSTALVAFPIVDCFAIDFEQEVWPILKNNCLECHKSPTESSLSGKKPKGDLSLDSKFGILKGGESGPVITAKSSSNSMLYKVVTLPEYDDLHMPPKGRPLTEREIKTIKNWIDSGAEFADWKGNAPTVAAAPMPNVTNKEETTLLTFDFEATKSKGDAKKGETFVFKGFYLGMTIADAQGLLNHYLGREQVSSTPIDAEKLPPDVRGAQVRADGPYRIYLKKDGVLFLARHWIDNVPFAKSGPDGVVHSIYLSNELRNKLFGSTDMPTDEFLQTFVNAYNIPEMKATRIELKNSLNGEVFGAQNILQYRSPDGCEITYWDKMIVFDARNAFGNGEEQGTITIRRIASETQRKSKFD